MEDITRNMLAQIRRIKESNNDCLLLEDNDNESKGAIAITDDTIFGENVLTHQIDNFRSAVDGSAEFAEPSDNVSECPLIYIPKNNNVIFSGTIPALNNLEFQFVLKSSTGNGCFIWADGLIMSKENMKVLNKLQGFYENWKDEWNSSARELDNLKNIK